MSQKIEKLVAKRCQECHPFTLDANHDFACTICHAGPSEPATKELAHQGLIPQPASPDNMVKMCGNCHSSLVSHINKSSHFTLADEVNLIRTAFGANDTILDPRLIPQSDQPQSVLELADDLLRRRCLRCHLFSSGDTYPATKHGTGCAACHLKFNNGSLVSHIFERFPEDTICLSCHYGNFVGADYYGLFEHDYNWEYQTPFTLDNKPLPYGVNQHTLIPDIHQTAGLSCIDCHSGSELMGDGSKNVTCETCHANSTAPPTLTTKIQANQLAIPQIDQKNHTNKAVSCQVCHAQWSFTDYGTHLIRIDSGEFDPWAALTKQGSSQVEKILDHNLFSNDRELEPQMSDQFSGVEKMGIWLKGFELRRWEDMPTCLDNNNILQICRPILDLYLSFINEDGDVIIDATHARSTTAGLRPYAPHTIGKAGAFHP